MAQRESAFQAPTWDSDDGANLRAFLASETGKRFTYRLINERPGFAEAHNVKGDLIQVRALEAAKLDGWECAVHAIFEFISNPVAEGQQSSVYPALEDDGLWDRHLTAELLQEPTIAAEEASDSVPLSAEPLPDTTPKQS